MKASVKAISEKGRAKNGKFIVIAKDGLNLTTTDFSKTGPIDYDYLNAIDGVIQSPIYFGTGITPVKTAYYEAFLNRIKTMKKVMVMDFTQEAAKIAIATRNANTNGYISFQRPYSLGTSALINGLPTPDHLTNTISIASLNQAKNFILIDDVLGGAEVNTLSNSNYDIVILPIYETNRKSFITADRVSDIKKKGGVAVGAPTRLVLAYLPIGKLHKTSYKYKAGWNLGLPNWLYGTGPYHSVKYWNPEWKKILLKDTDSMMNKIIEAGFDGVVIDIDGINTWEYFCRNEPLCTDVN